MLVRLTIRDIVLIDRLDLPLAPGLLVVTGETGAGKSILLDAFGLALGGRGDGSLVREGAAQGQVIAEFDPPPTHPSRVAAQAADLEVDGSLILRRVQLPDGRTRGYVNDQPVSAVVMRSISASLVEIHGQHDERALIDPAGHRALLDAFGGLQADVAALRRTHAALRAGEEALANHRARVEKARAEADYLRHAVEELEALRPQADEEESLAARRQAMMAAQKMASELQDCLDLLTGPGAPSAGIGVVLRRLERGPSRASEALQPALEALERALRGLDEAEAVVEGVLRAGNFEPAELEKVEERLFALRAAARKHQVAVSDLAALAERMAAELAALDAGEAELARLAHDVEGVRGQYTVGAAALSLKRRRTAEALDRAVDAELAPLKLERARFTTVVEEGAPGPEGTDRVEFCVQTNPGTRAGPMMKVASGGELSRFMLALKVALADRGSAPTLVFDEIDSGVGGAVADAIGQRLARLAGGVQVLAVTHAPQVAARAATHLLIAKQPVEDGSRVATRVTRLDEAARREEIARMLAGETITNEARAAAERLLAAG